jgi:ribosome maturation factor RimP
MQQPSPLAQKVEQAIEGLLSHVGYDIILVEFLPQSRLLRLYIDLLENTAEAVCADAPHGTDRVITLDDCTKVSRLVSDVLDGEGIMETGEGVERGGSYRLEVSSPGLDRPLVKPAHFRRFVGQPVRLRTRTRLEGIAQKRFEALLTAADDDGIAVTVDNTERHIAYTDLDRAQLVPTF